MRTPLMLLSLSLLACGDKEESDTAGGEADADTDTDTDADTDADADADADALAESLCGEPVSFSDPGADEYVQWMINGTEYTARPAAGGSYISHGYLVVSFMSDDNLGALTFSSSVGEGLAAGVYPCKDPGSLVNGASLGVAGVSYPGSACVFAFAEDVADGGRVAGTLSAQLVSATGSPTVCVDARFSLADAP